MRKYTDKNGGLVVEKNEPTTKKTDTPANVNKAAALSTVSAVDMISTVDSYLTSTFPFSGDSSVKGECVFCGKKTAYSNRKVCVDCFKIYKEEIMDALKKSVEDVELRIE